MKRKISLIIAMVLAFGGSVLLGGELASATGKNGNTYCAVYYGKTAQYQQCAYVLKTYHNDELKAAGCSLSKKNPTPSEGCRVEISKHIVTNISGCDTSKNTYRDCVDHIYLGVAKKIATNDTKSGKAGMPLAAKCYTTAHENDSDCTKDEDSDNSGDSGSGSLDGNTKVPGGDTKKCSTLLPSDWCTKDGSGIGDVLSFIIAVLTGTVVVAGTVGIIICAVLILTARDNDQQLAMGKKRLMEVVIGMIAWIMLAVLANLFIPKSTSEIDVDTGMIQVESDEERTA